MTTTATATSSAFAPTGVSLPPSARFVVLYDGTCGVCAKSVQFVLPRDRRGLFAFAPLQSVFGRAVFDRHQQPVTYDSFRLVVDPATESETIVGASTGVLRILQELDAPWSWLAVLGRYFPTRIADFLYYAFARNRYMFGRLESCMVLEPRFKERFLNSPVVDM